MNVSAHQATRNVVIALGPKAALLVGRIIDGTTGRAIIGAQIILRRAEDPERTMLMTGPNRGGITGGFDLLVPTVPFMISVKAAGYEEWAYSGDGEDKHAGALQVAAGEMRELTIRLRPAK